MKHQKIHRKGKNFKKKYLKQITQKFENQAIAKLSRTEVSL